MKRTLYAAALVAAAAAFTVPAAGQTSGENRITRMIVYGNDRCPQGNGDIVICARRPERDRYRIPQELRDAPVDESDAESMSWAARAETMEYVGRSGIQSCSPEGPGGASGCWEQMMRAARGDRAAAVEQATRR